MSEKKSLLQKLKEVLSISRMSRPAADSESPPDRGSDITVEREPDTATEDAVKGTDTATEDPLEETADEPGEEVADGTSAEDAGPAESDDAAAVVDEAEPDGDPVDDIKGIGPTYAERLGEAGISTVGDLAAADAATVADAAQASESRAADWIERARAREPQNG